MTGSRSRGGRRDTPIRGRGSRPAMALRRSASSGPVARPAGAMATPGGGAEVAAGSER